MKKTRSLILAAAALFAFAGCQEPAPEPVTEPQAPVIKSAALTGLNGETKIKVGAPVKFVAEVTVEGSELNTYTLDIKNGEEILASAGGVLEGKSAKIEETLNK